MKQKIYPKILFSIFFTAILLTIFPCSTWAAAAKITDCPASLMQKDAPSVTFHQAKNGIYFTEGLEYGKEYNLYFHSISTNKTSKVHSFSRPDAVYVNDHGMYAAFCTYGWDSQKNTEKYTYTIESYSFDNGSIKKTVLTPYFKETDYSAGIVALGVDDSGRIYAGVGDNRILIFAPDGTKIAEQVLADKNNIYAFYAFDAASGNFYYRRSYEGPYDGETVSGTSVGVGNFSNGKLTMSYKTAALQYFRSPDYAWQEGSVRMIAPGKLAVLTQRKEGYVSILNSAAYKVSDTTTSFVQKKLAGESGTVPTFAVSEAGTVLFAARTESAWLTSWEASRQSMPTYGVLADMPESGAYVLVKTDEKELNAYALTDGSRLFTVHTSYDPFTFSCFGDKCVVLEKDGEDLYQEVLDLKVSDSLTVSANDMKVGENQKITLRSTGDYDLPVTYSSSDSRVLSVGKDGTLYAWKTGSAVITVNCTYPKLTRTITVKVTDSALSENKTTYKNDVVVGTVSTNIHLPANNQWGSALGSSLTALSDGGYLRVERMADGVLVETYDSSLKRTSSRSIKKELPIYEGFFAGKEHFYLVFGDYNPDTTTTKEVVRVVKYDKSWNRIADCRLSALNTWQPFRVGTIDMLEANGVLYIHTNHEMHNKHQANMTLAINQASMTLKDSYHYIGDTTQGYVSHSYEQYVETDGTCLYRADLGDGVPRGVTLSITPLTARLDHPSLVKTLIPIPGVAGTSTGFYLSGMELSEKNCLLVGTGYKNSGDSNANVFLLTADKRTAKPEVTWLTSNTSGVKYTVPKLVKLSEERFLMMWEEKNSSGKYTTKMVLLTGDGTLASAIQDSALPLSDCEPIVTKNKTVLWYVTDNSQPRMIEINPYNLENAGIESIRNQEEEEKKQEEISGDPGTDKDPDDTDIPQSPGILLSKGTNITYDNAAYKVTVPGLTGGEVSYSKPRVVSGTMKIPATITYGKVTYKVTSVADSAFAKNTKVQKVVLGTNVKTLGKKAFYKCKNLKAVTGGSGLKKIGSSCFEGDTKLTQVGSKSGALTLGKLTTIGSKAFLSCLALKKVSLTGTALTSLGDQAFAKCTALKNVQINSKVLKKIGKQAFYGDKALTGMILKTTALKSSGIGKNAFKGISSKCVIQVPKSKKSAYQTLFRKKGASGKIKFKAIK